MIFYPRWLLLVCFLFLFPFTGLGAAEPPASFVGAQACAGCHADEFAAWGQSHHALAMQKATEATVVGDFADAHLEHFGVTTTFTRDKDRFLVRTDGPDGAMHQYEVVYTFGVAPLQQYLIAFPDGRLQALGIAWDNRPKSEGGQRWFHLYPDQKLAAGDRLHWTGRDQTWNYMCADCHSTNLKKNYDSSTDAYGTTWSEMNVACEACHGPGSAHIKWAESAASQPASNAPAQPPAAEKWKGLTNWLAARDGGHWETNPDTGIAKRTAPLLSNELTTCGACHSRRKVIAKDPVIGAPFLDSYLPALLDAGLYHADGQIDGEVFEYGSFLQSRMHRAGVTCSNCHEPHGLKLRADGNAVCAQCHAPSRFDTTSHHHHEANSAGGQCIACHMTTKVYMGVDRRHDHSFRVPRPDLSISLGVPNACTSCHQGRSDEWAAKAVAEWYPDGRQTMPHYGMALHAGRVGSVDAERLLGGLIRDRSQPGIARATALSLLSRYLSPSSFGAVQAGANDADPLVRMATPRAVPTQIPAPLVPSLMPLLSDRLLAVRIEAARALASVDPTTMSQTQRKAFDGAFQELLEAEQVDADRPEAHLNIGLLHLRRQDMPGAEAEYRAALRLDPNFVPGLINLADLERLRGQDADAIASLQKALAAEPDNADAHHAMGLALVRQRKYGEALAEFRKATTLAPDNARYAYVYAIALNGTGSRDEAIKLLADVHRRHPTDQASLLALVTFTRDAGDIGRAAGYAKDLVALDPANAAYRSLLAELQRRSPNGGSGR